VPETLHALTVTGDVKRVEFCTRLGKVPDKLGDLGGSAGACSIGPKCPYREVGDAEPVFLGGPNARVGKYQAQDVALLWRE
jgi:hypothetical protein